MNMKLQLFVKYFSVKRLFRYIVLFLSYGENTTYITFIQQYIKATYYLQGTLLMNED